MVLVQCISIYLSTCIYLSSCLSICVCMYVCDFLVRESSWRNVQKLSHFLHGIFPYTLVPSTIVKKAIDVIILIH